MSCDSFRLSFYLWQTDGDGVYSNVGSVPFGHSGSFGHLHQCLSVSESKRLPGTALVLLMDRVHWPLSSFLWYCGRLEEHVCTKTKFFILVSIAKKK